MDSFYDAPRRPPQLIPKEMFPGTPVVPEISVLCPSNTNIPRNSFVPYNQWKKDTIPNNFLSLNKENINGNFQSTQNNSILKKQVRFESPVLQQIPLENNQPFLNNTDQNLPKNQAHYENSNKPHNHGQAVSNFEQMYMANIPTRQLDLSVIDLPKRTAESGGRNQSLGSDVIHKKAQTIDKDQPKTYREFLDSKKTTGNNVVLNDSVTDIFNYKRNVSPKVVCNAYKIGLEESIKDCNNQYSPVFSPKDSRSVLKYPRHDQKENKGEKPAQLRNAFQQITEAISRRISYDNTFSQNVEQSRDSSSGPANDTTQKKWFLSDDNDCDGLENKVPIEGNKNLQHISEEIKNDLRNKYFQNHCTETPRPEVKHNIVPKIQVDNGSQTVPSLLGYNLKSSNSPKHSNHSTDCRKLCERFTQTTSNFGYDNNALKMQSEDNFSVKDLLKIIAQQSQQITQQNEQLLLLQKQVSTLICQQKENRYPRQKSIQCGQDKDCCQEKQYCGQPRYCCTNEQYREEIHPFVPGTISKNLETIQDICITSTQHENYDDLKKKSDASPKNKNSMPNFSIGLKTSFEVSFRRPHCNKHLPEFDQHEPLKIQEITEIDSAQSQGDGQQNFQNQFDKDNRETLVDESMIFKEPIKVRESCPSPEPSIKINMNDFEDSEAEDELTSPEIGPSFYRNLMVQVNKILQKAQIETAEEMAYNFKGQNLKHNTLNKVKEATFKHLRRIGVEVQNSDDSSQTSNSSDGVDSKSYNQEDISFAVTQLLMKYLPADHLAKATYKEAPSGNNAAMITSKGKIGAIKNRPDFSFATVQYMKKYNLIANNKKDFCQTAQQNQQESPKILDITKLKQQPKLL